MAINFLIQGVNVAQNKGVYTLADANLLHQSIKLINQVMVKSFGSQAELSPKSSPQSPPSAQHDDDDDVDDKVKA